MVVLLVEYVTYEHDGLAGLLLLVLLLLLQFMHNDDADDDDWGIDDDVLGHAVKGWDNFESKFLFYIVSIRICCYNSFMYYFVYCFFTWL